MEYSCMADKILRLLEKTLYRNHDLLDFAIIPTEENTANRSPVILEENHLGLESWCIKYVYQYACNELFEARKSAPKNKLRYPQMVDLNYLLIGALFVNPDVGTFWNMRREMVEADVLNYQSELKLCQLILTSKSKSNEVFAYRKWLLKRVIEKMRRNNIHIPIGFLNIELQVTLEAARNAQNNYHAWNHRIWAIENLSDFSPHILEGELAFSEQWISQHVSENSGFHYRQYIIESIKKYSTSVLEHYYFLVLKKLNVNSDHPDLFLSFLSFFLGPSSTYFSTESVSCLVNYISVLLYDLLVTIENMNKTFPGHETIWLHRRYVIFGLMKVAYQYHNVEFRLPTDFNSGFKNVKNDVVRTLNMSKQPITNVWYCTLYQLIMDAERKFVDSSKFSNRHVKWLKFVLNLETS